MSERVPGVEDIRQALRGDGWTLDEADEGIERIKQRGIGIGHEMARETMQASIGDAVRKLQAIAWDEGQGATELADNPYWKDAHPYSTPAALVAAYEDGQRDAVEKGLARARVTSAQLHHVAWMLQNLPEDKIAEMLPGLLGIEVRDE